METTAPSRLRTVVIPAEHGGWSLTLEPVVLGLAIAPSAAGSALGIAALAAFLFRTPLKTAAGDLRRGRLLPRTRIAMIAAAGYGAVLAGAVAAAALSAEHPFWIPLAAGAPLMLMQAAYDVWSRSRRLLPEMAGPVGIGSVAAGIALAGGGTTTLSFGLWLIIGLRSIAAVVLVRSQLRRGKGRPYRAWPVHLIDVAAGAGAIGAAATGIVPWLGAGVIAALTPFGFWSLARPAVPTVVVGIHQVALGVLVVAATVVGVRAGL